MGIKPIFFVTALGHYKDGIDPPVMVSGIYMSEPRISVAVETSQLMSRERKQRAGERGRMGELV